MTHPEAELKNTCGRVCQADGSWTPMSYGPKFGAVTSGGCIWGPYIFFRDIQSEVVGSWNISLNPSPELRLVFTGCCSCSVHNMVPNPV